MNESALPHSARPGARRAPTLVGFGLLAISLAFAYREVFALVGTSAPEQPIRVDASPDLAFVLFLVMLVYRRSDLRRAAGNHGGYGPACALLAPSALVLLWAHFQSASDLLFPSLALAILGGSWLLGGGRLCRTLIPCVAILLFAMPIPAVPRNQIVYALQTASAWLASGFLDALNVTHARAGDILELGANSFQVVEECSGIGSIGALSLAAVFYVGLFRCPPVQAALLITVAPAIGLLANSIRVLWLTLGDPSGAGEEHSLQGLAVIALGALALGGVDRLLGLVPGWRAKAQPPPGRRRPLGGTDRRRIFVLCALFITLGAALAALPSELREPGDASARMARILAAFGSEQETDVEIDYDFLGTTGFDATLNKRFRVDRRSVDLFVGIDDRLDRLRSGRSPKTVVPGPKWRVMDRRRLALEFVGPNAEALEMENGMTRVLVYHWTLGFDSLGSEARRSLIGLEPRRAAPRPGFVVRLTTPLHGGENSRGEAVERLRSIMETLRKSLSPDRPLGSLAESASLDVGEKPRRSV